MFDFDINKPSPVPCPLVLLFDTVSLCNYLKKSQTKLFSMKKDFKSSFDPYSSSLIFDILFYILF